MKPGRKILSEKEKEYQVLENQLGLGKLDRKKNNPGFKSGSSKRERPVSDENEWRGLLDIESVIMG